VSSEQTELSAALAHLRAGQLVDAAEIYRRILDRDPCNSHVLHLLGNIAFQLGDANDAIRLITRAFVLSPGDTRNLISMGMAYLSMGQPMRALHCYLRALEFDRTSASAHFGVANTQQSLGRLEDAARHFASAIELHPAMFEARYNLANLLKSAGSRVQAVDQYRAAIALKPDFADAFHNMASTMHALGWLDEALAGYGYALWRDLPETHNNIGNVYSDQGRFDQAIASFQRAIALRPEWASAHRNLGSTLRKLGFVDDAVAALRPAILLAPDQFDAHLSLGDSFMMYASFEDATREYESAIVLAPAMPEPHFQIGIAKSQQGNPMAARACFARAIACYPDHVNAIYNLGCINGRLQDNLAAEQCYIRVLELDSTHVEAHINLSAILRESGRPFEAKQHLELAYSRKNLFEKYSQGARRTVLIMFHSGSGNMNLTHLFNERTNNLIDWMIEYATDAQFSALPPHDLVFNAMGDPDLTGDLSSKLDHFLGNRSKPLLNHPERVALTARHRLPGLLRDIEQLLVPQVWRLAGPASLDNSIEGLLPLVLRPVYSHGGLDMELVRSAEEFHRYCKRQSGPLYVSRFIDYRSGDGWYRKYRMIFIDRNPHAYHLAISRNWMVHYHNADMESHPWKLEEELAFLRDPEAVIGRNGMDAIRAIASRLDLDYAGIDFSLMPDGRVLVFEANSTMLVHPESATGLLAPKNPYVQRILDAFEQLLARTAEGSQPDR